VARLGQEFRLGRNCALTIDGNLMVGIEDATVRVVQREIDATRFGFSVSSSVVTHRSLEVSFTTPDYKVIAFMRDRMSELVGSYYLPRVVSVVFYHGVLHNQTWDFIIHELDSDEPLNGPVRARFLLKQVTNANNA
jgi:hypothetical protein